MWEGICEAGERLACLGVGLLGLWQVASDDGCFGPGVQDEFYGACGGLRTCARECEVAYYCSPWVVFIIRYLASATVVCGVGR